MAKFETLSISREPQCFISTTSDGKLEITTDILEELKQLDKPLVVVAIAGLYRTGKSYLLNRLAGRNSGFALGSAIQSKTKGVWIWVVNHPNNSDQYLLLMDTEGLGDFEKGDANHDNWIFCLAILLSSVLVYNTFGAINEDVLEKLNFITEMSNHLQAKSSDKEANETNFDWYFPMFVFALRDFTLELEIDGRKVTSDEYMEHCLELKQGSGSSVQKSNIPRACIRKYFKTRKCFTFDRPTSTSKLKDLDQLQDSDLSEDFLEETEDFCTLIYTQAGAKKLENDTILNGKMLASLATMCVDAIRNGIMPCMENAVEAMAKIENTRRLEEAVDLYVNEIKSRVIFPTSDDNVLSNAHEECLKLAVDHFVKGAVFDRDHRFQLQLNDQIQQSMENFVLENEAASTKKCRELLARLNEPIAKKLKAGIYATSGGFQKYQQNFNTLQLQYQSTSGLGVKKDQVLMDYINERLPEGEGILAADQRVTQKKQKAEAERQQAQEMAMRMEAAKRERDLQRRLAEDKQRALERNIQEIQRRNAEERVRLTSYYDYLTTQRLNEQQRQVTESFQRQTDQLQNEIRDLRYRSQPQPIGGGSYCIIL